LGMSRNRVPNADVQHGEAGSIAADPADYECQICRAFGSTKRISRGARWGYLALDLQSREHVGNTAGSPTKRVPEMQRMTRKAALCANGSRVPAMYRS
jgi:hypothetical protein